MTGQMFFADRAAGQRDTPGAFQLHVSTMFSNELLASNPFAVLMLESHQHLSDLYTI